MEQLAVRNDQIRNLETMSNSADGSFESEEGVGSTYVSVLFSSLCARKFQFVSSLCGVICSDVENNLNSIKPSKTLDAILLRK